MSCLEEDDFWEDSEDVVSRVQAVLFEGQEASTSSTSTTSSATGLPLTELEKGFQTCDRLQRRNDQQEEFLFMETFIQTEQRSSQQRRIAARKLESSEEQRLAQEVAHLKSYRLKSLNQHHNDELRWKIAHAETSFVSRKMVYAKASQVASQELRQQFVRVRQMLERVHTERQKKCTHEHKRRLNFVVLMHTLKGTDPRLIGLEKQIAVRLYRKHQADLNEYHMAQTLEEAVYLEAMMNVLDKVQNAKEQAAREVFEHYVAYLKQERHHNERRQTEMELFAASATLEMAKLVAQYTEENHEDCEQETLRENHVNAMERSKYFADQLQKSFPNKGGSSSTSSDSDGETLLEPKNILSVGKLYDTVLWSAATRDLGLTTSTASSSLLSSDYGSDIGDVIEDEDEETTSTKNKKKKSNDNNDEKKKKKEKKNMEHSFQLDDDAVEEDGNGDDDDEEDNEDRHRCNQEEEDNVHVEDSNGEEDKCLTPIGNLHAKHLAKELRAKEKALLKKHREEIKREKRQYWKESRQLKAKLQQRLDSIIEQSQMEKELLREQINERMEQLYQRQMESTRLLKQKDTQLMKDALFAEDQRILEAEASSFLKAQELVSAQVFHEVRNALSSVIAMGEMTSTLKTDTSLEPEELVSNVNTMLEQLGDVVDYALQMLNEILDISKINSGAFIPKKDAFDLGNVVARATRMQQPKASGRIQLSFVPPKLPVIAVSDPFIVERIVATMISNAVKFTDSGAVQPFIWPLEELEKRMAQHPQNQTQNQGQQQHYYPQLPSSSSSSSSNNPNNDDEEEEDDNNSHTGNHPNEARFVESEPSTTSSSTSSTVSTICTINSSNTTTGDDTMSDYAESTTTIVSENHYTDNMLQLSNKKMKYVAVGVADTGHGLSEDVLQSSKFVISTSTSKKSNHGAQNTGFGLYHSHLQARALNTHLKLASIESCTDLLNDDMVLASRKYQQYQEQKRRNHRKQSSSSSSLCQSFSTYNANSMTTATTTIVDQTNNNNANRHYNLYDLKSGSSHSTDNGDKYPTRSDIPGRGTILYFTIPVYEDSEGAEKALLMNMDELSRIENELKQTDYIFRPLPPAGCANGGCFRILVADDVLMLRKGMVHSIGQLWSKQFPDCPVSVSTACSAEDVVRAARLEPFDLIICDHHFDLDTSKLNVIVPGDSSETGKRPCMIYNNTNGSSSTESLRKSTQSFFKSERFTIEEEDGSLLGLNALFEIVESQTMPYPTPILMLVSGHKIEVDPSFGIIVIQKPLKQSEFISSLESHALGLLYSGRCMERDGDDRNHPCFENSSDNNEILMNLRGSQLFVRVDDGDGDGAIT